MQPLETAMKKLLLSVSLFFLLLVVVLTSFFLGVKTEQDRFSFELSTTQAMLSFNHLTQFKEIETDLSKNCIASSLEKTRIAIDKELMLLSSFEKKNENTWVNKYILDRDPDLLNQLKTFKSKYGNSWRKPECMMH